MSPVPSGSGRELRWRVHLARRRPGWAGLVVVATAISMLLCWHLFGSLLFVLCTGLALVGATAEFLFPIHYYLGPDGAESRNLHNWRRIAWTDVQKAYLLDDAVKLSPLRLPTRLEPFRGVLLRFGEEPGTKEAVLDAVREFRERAGRDADRAGT